MKVWLYYRLSRDEDDELNSLTNQRKIIYEYAVTNGHEVVGESFDDNVSGMCCRVSKKQVHKLNDKMWALRKLILDTHILSLQGQSPSAN